MNMDQKELKKLFKKYRTGRASEQEIEFLRAYYNLFETEDNITDQLNRAEKDALKEEIRANLLGAISLEKNKRKIGVMPWAAVAGFLIFIGTALFFYKSKPVISSTENAVSRQMENISPGGNKATLTLADGSTIVLEGLQNGTLAKEGSAEVKKTGEGQLVYDPRTSSSERSKPVCHTVSIPRGGEYRLTLPDGSNVWLNSASSIKFPTAFTGNQRRVEITGEAYFEVAKQLIPGVNKKMPFVVVTPYQTIEVLGTHFNVNTYDDEEVVKTTLFEGSVRVSPKSGISKVLTPGRQAQTTIGSADQAIKVVEADLDEVIAWKNGYFKFNRSDIKSLMRQVSRWYNLEVEYTDKIPDDEFVGMIKRSDNVSSVLRVLQLSKVKCRLEGRKIVIGN